MHCNHWAHLCSVALCQGHIISRGFPPCEAAAVRRAGKRVIWHESRVNASGFAGDASEQVVRMKMVSESCGQAFTACRSRE